MGILKRVGRVLSDPTALAIIGCASVTGYFLGTYAYDKVMERTANCAGDPASPEPREGREKRRTVSDEGHRVVANNPAMPRPKIAVLERNKMADVVDYTSFVTHRTVQDPDVKKALDERYADALDGDRVEEVSEETEVRKDDEDSEEDDTVDETDEEGGDDLPKTNWAENIAKAKEYWLEEYGMKMTPNMCGLLALQWDDEEGHLLATPKVGLPEREIYVPEKDQITSERFKVIDQFDFKQLGHDYLGYGYLRYWPADDMLLFDEGEIPEICTCDDLNDKVRGIWERRGLETIYLLDQWDDIKYEISVEGQENSEYPDDLYGFRSGWVLWWAEQVKDKMRYFERQDGTRGWIHIQGDRIDDEEDDIFSDEAIGSVMVE